MSSSDFFLGFLSVIAVLLNAIVVIGFYVFIAKLLIRLYKFLKKHTDDL